MGSKLSFGLIIAIFTSTTALADPPVEQCPPVDCDCRALDEPSWRSECEAQQSRVRSQCGVATNGLKLYCSAHGPSAFPVATSIQAADLDLEANESSQFLLKLTNTQSWSLGETYNTYRASVEKANLRQAIQLGGLVDAESQKLFAVQKRAVTALVREGKGRKAHARALEYGEANARHAAAISQYSEDLWQRRGGATQDRERRGLEILSFKAARAAAASYEFAADLAADGKATAMAAEYWQRSAVIAQRLIEWESASGKNLTHLSYYQSQAASRWYRATFYWLQLQDLRRAATGGDFARAYTAGVDPQNGADLEN